MTILINTTSVSTWSFDSVRRGQHIIGRRFEFIVKSPRNRAAFVKQLSQVLPQEKRYSIEELHQFTEILCPDFPVHALHHAEQLACHAQGMQGFESEPICIPPLNISAVTLGGLTSKSQTRTKPSLILENGPTLFSSIFMAAFRVCFIYHEFLVFMLNSIERQFESFKVMSPGVDSWTSTELYAIEMSVSVDLETAAAEIPLSRQAP
ncbi:hypothetical protein BASA50_000266 [Batrachochytrium salamandrivorans]|uniref:Centriolar satellite-associated tubulin polyglutamylase complex regulator 1 n=1 Tax=Batrachochytrium salamandrivorans TaxID=1357716 RepID=A0ABQ8EUQ1_9FUNG|nr:hypothetical protein BASA50_000266 [Batrachochytrium salamandrivorans]